MIEVEAVGRGDPADFCHRVSRGEETAEIEDRIDDDRPLGHGVDGGSTQENFFPRNREGEFLVDLDGCVPDPVQQDSEFVEGNIGLVLLLESTFNQRGKIGDRRFALERCKNRLNSRDLQRELVQILELAIEQSVFLEELTRARDVDLFKEVGSLGEGIPKRMGRISSEFRRFAVDDDKHHVFDIWKAAGELEIVLSSGKMFRDESYVVRVDAEVYRRVAEARHGH